VLVEFFGKIMDEKAKKEIVAKYDAEAVEKDNAAWLSCGNDVRVPESRAAHYFIDRKVEEAIKLYGHPATPSATALEIGCSFGHMTALLAAKFENLTAVDISPASIRLAEKRVQHYGVGNVSFVVDDAESLEKIPDGAFDVAFAFSTIRFCANPQNALDAIYKKLRPGGVAIIDFPNKFSPWHLFVKRAIGIRRHVHDTLYSKAGALRLFENAGFKVDGVKQFLFTTRRLPTVLLPLSIAADFILERLPLIPGLAGIIMVKGVKDR
jgi:ubiquinone/menaquinone biosynthesis C-methylase UbiE